MLFVSVERERERFLEREPLELELVMGPTIFVLIFSKIYTSSRVFGAVRYMFLKTENCYLKIFMKIRVGKKVYKNT